MENEYELDYVIDEFLLATVHESVYNNIINTIEVIDKLNNINKRYVDIVNNIETDILEQLQNDGCSEEDKVTIIKAMFIEKFRKTLLIHGIKIEGVVELHTIANMFNVLLNVYNLDPDQHQIVIDIIDTDDENGITYKLALIISEYSQERPTDLFEIIEDVDESLFVDFKERFVELERIGENMEDTVLQELEFFISYKNEFSETITSKTSFQTGELYDLIEEDLLYTVLEMYNDTPEIIPFEVILALYVHHKDLDTVLDEISSVNLDNITFLEEKHVVIDELQQVMMSLITELKGK